MSIDVDTTHAEVVDGPGRPERQEVAVSQLRKGVLGMLLLSLCAQTEQYTAELVSALAGRGMHVSAATLYPALGRLADSGLLATRLVEVPSGPARRYYRTTRLGKRELAQLVRAWNELAEIVDAVTAEDPPRVPAAAGRFSR